MAFSFIGESDKIMRDDPRYVKIIARFWQKADGQKKEVILKYHKCTSDDYTQFYPITPKQKSVYNEIIADNDRGFYCVDWDDSYQIYGDTYSD